MQFHIHLDLFLEAERLTNWLASPAPVSETSDLSFVLIRWGSYIGSYMTEFRNNFQNYSSLVVPVRPKLWWREATISLRPLSTHKKARPESLQAGLFVAPTRYSVG